MVQIKYKCKCYISHVSNCDDPGENENDEANNGDDDTDETIVIPPDHFIAQEMAEEPQDVNQGKAVTSIKKAVKVVTSGIYPQET